jgi:predicted SnoaL-like aldol condensation-catalyzing enzyme
MPRSVLRFALLFALACSPGTSASSDASCNPDAESNRARVLAFYRDALVNRNPRAAFTKFMAADFVEHKPDVSTGSRDSTIAFLERLMQDLPEGRWQIHRSIADQDLVFVHASFTPAKGTPAYAIADVFRLRECQIVEHWDVVGPPSERQLNPQSRF